MFSTKNVLTVTKSAISQLIGKGFEGVETGNLTALDSQFIVDLGEKLGISEDGTIGEGTYPDIFFKALITQCGKIIVDTRSYVASLPKLWVDTINWGGFTEVITTELSDVMIDEMWNTNGFIPYNQTRIEGDETIYEGVEEGKRIASVEYGCYKPVVNAKIFKKNHALMCALTVAREQMFTAFRGLDEYERFLAGLFNSVENTLQAKAEVYALMTVSMGIAKATANKNSINLLKEYNDSHPDSTTTKAKALYNADFMKFALMRIAETRDNIKRMSAMYNDHDHVTFSSEANLILLNKFSNSAKFNVRANTYHEELLGVGEYDKVSAWQGAIDNVNKTPYNFETASTVSLSAGASTEAGFKQQTTITGVIGVLYDRYAMGINLDRRKVTSKYAASRDTTNYFYHNLINYTVNDSFPIVAFVIEDEGD